MQTDIIHDKLTLMVAIAAMPDDGIVIVWPRQAGARHLFRRHKRCMPHIDSLVSFLPRGLVLEHDPFGPCRWCQPYG